MAVAILGGIVTSSLLSLFVLPSLYLRFGRSRRADAIEFRAPSPNARMNRFGGPRASETRSRKGRT